MELTAKQQITELIKNSQKILVCVHSNPDGDALGSALALKLALKKIGKDTVVLCSDIPSKTFRFLPGMDGIKDNINGAKDFIISVNTSRVKVDKLGYKNFPQENTLNITLTPLSGRFLPEMISFKEGSFKFDLIIVLDSSDLERLGKIYDENTDLFYEVPVINIDHHAGNDHFGKVNWIELTATSTAEILVSLLESLGREKSLFDPDIATCLLTGLITDTGSFQNSNTTPKSFTVAAQLIAVGARQQEIIRNVYKTKSLSTLKLWGRILSRINDEKKYRFVWSSVSKSDFIETGASEDEVAGVVDELLKTAPNIDFALLLSERQKGVHGSMRGVNKGVNVAEIAKIFNGGGHDLAAAFHMPDTDLSKEQEEIIDKIKRYQVKRLNLNEKVVYDNFFEQEKQHIVKSLEMPPIDFSQ